MSRSGKNSGRKPNKYALQKYVIHQKERRPSGHTLPWCTWLTANRVRSGQAATPAAKHLSGLPGEQELYVRCSYMRSQPHSDELQTFQGKTDQKQHWENGGTICAVAECHCTHDMMVRSYNPTIYYTFLAVVTTLLSVG